jgi:S1-C subfamily serine protease
VVGVNAQIAGDTGGNVGVGFSIPSDTISSIATQLIGSGKVEHAYLGVSVQTIPATIAPDLKLVAGVEIRKATGGTPASKAGLKGSTGTKTSGGDLYATGGDVITAVDSQKITTSEELQRAIDAKQPGDTVSITYWRNGQSHTTQVKLATRPSALPTQG